MFGTFEQYKRMLRERQLSVTSSIVVAAFLAGCTEAILTPFERIQTLMLDHKYDHLKLLIDTRYSLLSF